jgi:hypothetical protein
MPFREKATKACARDTAGHFLRSGLSAKAVVLRGFPTIFRGAQPGFSATQTVWRSKSNSNPQYLPEWRKSRGVRKLQRIRFLSKDGGLHAVKALRQAGQFLVQPKGECLAILSLRWSMRHTSNGQIGSRVTACLQFSHVGKISPHNVLVKRRKAGDFSEIPTHASRHKPSATGWET